MILLTDDFDLAQKWNKVPEFHKNALKSLVSDRGSAKYNLKQANEQFETKLEQFERASAYKKEKEKASQEANAAVCFYLKSMRNDLEGLLSEEDIRAIEDGKFSVQDGVWKK